MAVAQPPIPPQYQAAAGLVGSAIGDASGLAQAAAASVQALGIAATFVFPPVIIPPFTEPTVPPLVAGLPPTDAGNLSVSLPPVPAAPPQQDIGALGALDAPAYTLSPPLLLDVPLPDPLTALAPPAPVLPDVATPTEPDFTLPEVPTFAALNIPDAPAFDEPLFTDVAPTAPGAPDVQFTWAEVQYRSDLLTDLNARLLGFLQGEASALPAEVEAAIVQKALDAEAQATTASSQDVMDGVAARGFAIGGGDALRAVQTVLEAALAKDTEASRTAMTDQARLEQANLHFAFSKAMTLEGQLITLFNQVQQRALDAAKFRVEAVVQLFNARVQLYTADAQAFAAKAEAFKARLTAALARLEVYKAELQAVQIAGQLNVQLAEQFKGQIEGVKALAEVYKARVQAVKVTVETNKNRIELYRGELEGFAALAHANTSLAQAALARVQGEQAKAELFAAQVGGYTSRVEAYRVLTDARLQEATVLFQQAQQWPIELYKGQVAAFDAQVGAEGQRLKAIAEVFASQVDAYAAGERTASHHTGAAADVAVAVAHMSAQQAKATVQAGLIAAKAAQGEAALTSASIRAAASASAQMASAAMAARNVSASVSGSISNSASIGASNTNNTSSSNSTSVSSSNAVNRSSTNSTSMGGGVNITDSFSMSDNQTASDTINQSVTNSQSQSVTNDNRREARNATAKSRNQRDAFSVERIYYHKTT